jgi:hypothetical protein
MKAASFGRDGVFDEMPMASLARRPIVLIVLHQEHSTPGRIGAVMRAMDVRLDIRRPSLGEPLPEKLADHDGVIVFAGAWRLSRRADAGAGARRAGVQLRG